VVKLSVPALWAGNGHHPLILRDGNDVTTHKVTLLIFPPMGVWQEVAMDSIKFHPGLLCPTLLRPEGGPLLKRTKSCFSGGLPSGLLLPL
jgi:hypothetical protein